MAVHKSKSLTTAEYKLWMKKVRNADTLDQLREVVTRLLEAQGYDAEVDSSTFKMDDAE